MRRKSFGTFLMVLGAVLVLAGAALFCYNQYEDLQAEKSVNSLLPEMIAVIEQEQQAVEAAQPEETEDWIPPGTIPGPDNTPAPTAPTPNQMTTAVIQGYEYIGYVTIPALELSLPVMADWSYPKLKVAPCRYSGAVDSDDLVIMAHNYRIHFGRISELAPGDSVTFTDMNGNVTFYEVVALDILTPTAVADMVAGEYDLTLFTCTYGGKSRVTLRCDRITE